MPFGGPGANVPPLLTVVPDNIPVPPRVAPESTVIPLAAERSPLTKNVPLCTVQGLGCEKVPVTVQVELPTLLKLEKPSYCWVAPIRPRLKIPLPVPPS